MRSVLSFLLARWRVALVALPAAALAGGVRAAVWAGTAATRSPSAAGFTVDAAVLNAFISASIFVLAILVNGVVADFKESEKIPAEIESAFQALLAHVMLSAKMKKFDPSRELNALRAMLLAIARSIDKTAPYDACARELLAADVALLEALEDHKSAANSTPNFTNTIRSRVSRIFVISDTSFLLPAYALFDTLVAIVHVLLIVAVSSTYPAGIITAAVFSFLFVYLGFLVRDLDDPFGYPPTYQERCLEMAQKLPISARNTLSDASSIDFSILFLSFVAILNSEIDKAGEGAKAAIASQADGKGAGIAPSKVSSVGSGAGRGAGGAGGSGGGGGGGAGSDVREAAQADLDGGIAGAISVSSSAQLAANI